MIGAVLMILFGGVLVGGAISFYQQKKPKITIVLLLVAGLVALGVGWYWSVQ